MDTTANKTAADAAPTKSAGKKLGNELRTQHVLDDVTGEKVPIKVRILRGGRIVRKS